MSKVLASIGLDIDLTTPISESTQKSDVQQHNSKYSRLESDYRIVSELLSAYLSVKNNYRSYYDEIRRARDTYIGEVILEQLTYDALTPEVSSDRIIEISLNIDNDTLAKELQAFDERFNIDQLILDITPDLIAYGSYTLRPIIKEGEGIVEIVDDVVPGEVIPFFRNIEIQFYLRVDPDNNKLSIHDPTDYVSFFINAKRIRLKLSKQFLHYVEEQKGEMFPRFIKIGSPLFTPGVIKKIKELDLLEKLVPASKIQSMSKGNIVGVYVPPTMSPEEAFEYARKLERKINALGISVDKDLDQLSIAEILKGAGRTKVIPVTSEKGQTTKLDFKPDEPSDLLSFIQDNRNVILTSVGIPPEIIFNSGSNTKGEILKRYSRYLRKIKYIQKAIISGVKELILIHLINKGLPVTPNDFTVRFKNSLTTVDHLDNLEVVQATVQILSDVKRFVDDLTQDENLSQYVSTDNFAKYLNSEFTKIGLDAVIVLPEEGREL